MKSTRFLGRLQHFWAQIDIAIKGRLLFWSKILLSVIILLLLMASCAVFATKTERTDTHNAPVFLTLRPISAEVLHPDILFQREVTITLPETLADADIYEDTWQVAFCDEWTFENTSAQTAHSISANKTNNTLAAGECIVHRDDGIIFAPHEIILYAAEGPAYEYTLHIVNNSGLITVNDRDLVTGIGTIDHSGTYTLSSAQEYRFRLSISETYSHTILPN